MTCDQARYLTSVAIDEPLQPDQAAAVHAHRAGCRACHSFAADLDDLRRRLRIEPVSTVPDIAGAVRSRLEDQAPITTTAPRRIWLQAAAAFILAFTVGAVAIGPRGAQPVRAESIAARVLAAQTSLSALTARVAVTERGWHPRVAVRTYTGSLSYRAPESFTVRLQDTTTYPSPAWPPNDVARVLDEDIAWSRGRLACPAAVQPACSASAPRQRLVHARPPFDAGEPMPLDLILPATSFTRTDEPTLLGRRTFDGRDTIGVAVTVAQIQPLLDGVLGVGSWREIHPSDEAAVWLDAEWLVPVAVDVTPAESLTRRRWAAAHSYRDTPGTPILQLRLTRIEVDAGVDDEDFAVPTRAAPSTNAGFTDASPAPMVVPTWLPAGAEEHRAGTIGATRIASWSDGLAWLRITATRSWNGGRLFGGFGDVVREVALPGGGVAFVGDGGARVGLHGESVDLVVTGTYDEQTLLGVAAGLDVEGLAVPTTWPEHRATEAEAARALPGMLTPTTPSGFDSPGIGVQGQTVVLAYDGPGARAFAVIQDRSRVLSPPLDADVVGLTVRGHEARYTPARGELEWVERGIRVMVRSATLDLEELLAIAATLREP